MGMAAKDHVCKVRLDSFTDRRLARMTKVFGISKAEAIRQGILLYLEKMEEMYPELKCN